MITPLRLVVIFHALLPLYTCASAAVITSQSFETIGSGWVFSSTPATYNTETTGSPSQVNGSEDVWGVVEEFTGDLETASDGTLFWGIQDLNNANGGGDFDHVIAFENYDVSSDSSLVLRFDYNAVDWESTDSMRYIVYIDDIAQSEVNLGVGGVGGSSTGGWITETIAIPDVASAVRIDLIANQNGDDFGGWDFVRLETTAVPEPSLLTVLAVGPFLYGCPVFLRKMKRKCSSESHLLGHGA